MRVPAGWGLISMRTGGLYPASVRASPGGLRDCSRCAYQRAEALPQCVHFEPKGYTTHLASCGREAIKIARNEEVHLMIFDVHLPDYSGLETFKIIKKEIRLTIPCIFMSGEITKELQIDLISANAYTLIPKPININILRESVEQVIAKYYWK